MNPPSGDRPDGEAAGDAPRLRRRMSPEQARKARFNRTSLTRRGLDEDEVYSFVQRLATELGDRDAELTKLVDENRRLKQAMREWQSQQADRHRGVTPDHSEPPDDEATTTGSSQTDVPALPASPMAGQLTPQQATAETAALIARAQQQIDAQVAQTELYCRQREEEASRRYDEIVDEARRQAKADAERVAQQYRTSAGSFYSSDQEQVQRQQVYLTALLHALDALATHVHATRHAFTVEFQKLGGQLDYSNQTDEDSTSSGGK